MDINDELIARFIVLLILFMQSLHFHIKMPPSFLGFMVSVVAIDIEEIINMLVCSCQRSFATWSLGETKVNDLVFHIHLDII
jgi:hypothetical protein